MSENLFVRLLKRGETPERSEYTSDSQRFSESKLALYGLIVSSCAILVKLFSIYHVDAKQFVFENKLNRLEYYQENGEIMYKYAWFTTVKYSTLWLPLLCGLLATYITWLTVYLDSQVPGVHPPSPLSPSKYKRQSGHSFHINYVFALMIGVLVASYMYFKRVSIEF